MKILTTAAEMTAWSNRTIGQGRTICLVPTMGFFHDGHLALMRQGVSLADRLVVTLFVNPIQFGPNEDLDRYPRAFERDCRLAAEQGTEALFAPDASEMYPAGFQTSVQVDQLTEPLCGRNRPGHFNGVTTVVAKLFNLIKPNVAVFGEKDYQQLAVIRRMVSDLDWDVEIAGHPIVRENDGLAMSSRNSYLSVEQRQKALCLSDSIALSRKMVQEGETDPVALIDEISRRLKRVSSLTIEYVSIVHGNTLENSFQVDRDSVLALAVKIGKIRLIDNGKLIV